MSHKLVNYRIFIASPSGLEEERTGFREVILNYNESEANQRGVNFSPIGWEITLGGSGRPQALINEDLKTCDYFVLILHDRWGHPTSKNGTKGYSSGSEEEFHLALEQLKNPKDHMKDILLFFKGVNERQMSDPGEQLRKVLEFRKERENEKDLLYHTYDTPNNFKDIFRRHLAQWVRYHEIYGEENIKVKKKKIEFTEKRGSIVTNFNNLLKSSTDNLLEDAEKLALEGKILEAEVAFSKLIVRNDNPYSIIRYSRFLRKIGQPNRAKVYVDNAIELAQRINDVKAEAYAIRQLGLINESFGNNHEAIQHYNHALEIYKITNDDLGTAKTLRNLGLALRKIGNLEEAKTKLEESRKYYEKAKDIKGIAASLGYLGVIYKAIGYLDKAEEVHKDAFEFQNNLSNREAVAIINGNLAVILRLKRKYDEAIKLHEQSLNYYQETGNQQGISREYSNLGAVYRLIKDYDKAANFHSKALEISEQLGNKYGIAIHTSNLGIIARLKGDLVLAEKKHKLSLDISLKLGDKIGEAIQYENLGVLNREKNNYELSKEYLMKSIELNEESGSKISTANALIELGKTFISENNYESAKATIVRALRIYEILSLQEGIDECNVLLNSL